MKATTETNHVWPAKEYHHHSSAQMNAAMQLLTHIRFKGNERIIDVGCGDGKITAKLASFVPSGSVLGIDLSSNMIDFAKDTFSKDNFSNLNFLLQGAQDLNYEREFDILFSSFALQWVKDHGSFLKKAYESLRADGYLVITVPLGISSALAHSIDDITSLPYWKPYFENFSPEWSFISDIEFKNLLERASFVTSRLAVIAEKVIYSSREDFEKYVRPWFSYLNVVPELLRNVFFNQIIDNYLRLEPVLENGKVSFQFSRLEIIAHKSLFDS